MGKLQNRTKLLGYWMKIQSFVCVVLKLLRQEVSNALELYNGSLIFKDCSFLKSKAKSWLEKKS